MNFSLKKDLKQRENPAKDKYFCSLIKIGISILANTVGITSRGTMKIKASNQNSPMSIKEHANNIKKKKMTWEMTPFLW